MGETQTVVVTGGNGFLGSAVARELVRTGARVRVLAGPPGKDSRPLDFAVEALASADIEDVARYSALFAGADVVVHAAGPPSVADSFLHPMEFMRVHALGTTAVLEVCRAAKVKRIVYISSAEVYGDTGGPDVLESNLTNARSPYAAAKIAGEQMVRAFWSSGTLEVVVLRPFSLYGPGMSSRGVVAEILAQAALGRQIQIRDPHPVRDFCFISDAACGVVAACSLRPDAFTICNLGSGTGTSIGELAKLAAELSGATEVVEAGDKRPWGTEFRRLVADTTAASELLQWRAATPLRDGLRKTIEWKGRK